MKSIKKALYSVLIGFGASMFLAGTVVYADEGTEVAYTETADNNFVDNNVTEENVTVNNTAVNYAVENNVIAVQDTILPETDDVKPETVDTTDASKDDKKEVIVKGRIKKKDKKHTKTKKYNQADLRLMSAIIFCEAGAEPYAGKVAVGIVVMNRVKSKSFPNTIKKVIYQKSQFSPVRNGSLNRALKRYDSGRFNSKYDKQCVKAAKEVLDGAKSVTYAGSTKSMKNYHYFSGSLKGARYRIKGHGFK